MRNDYEWFKVLYDTYYDILVSYSIRIVLKEDIAEDVVQEVFIECWHKRLSINKSVSLKPYLYTLTRTKSIDQIRRHNNNNTPFSDLEFDIDNLFFDTLTVENEISFNEIQQSVKDSIEALPKKCKEVFLLSREDKMKNKEIASLLNLSVKSVEKHITRAIKEIRTSLIDKGLIQIY